MAGSTKMILITSDEDIIRQFTLNNNKNTQIIDLDNNKHLTTIPAENNNDMSDMNFLAHLSGLNSNNDHIYKRALDSSDHVRLKPAKASKKSIDMICTICGDRAIGYNYNALSCASCKAFFRRHVNDTLEELPCLTDTGECLISYEERRKCQRCRLKRCLTMGMRKDFMFSEAEKERRKKRVEENQTTISPPPPNAESLSPIFTEIDQIMMDMEKLDENLVYHETTNSDETKNLSLETLSVEECMVIERIRLSFESVFQNDINESSFTNVIDHTSAVIFWSQVGSELALRFIKFFRQIDEFEELHADDRFILIKYNLFLFFPIYKWFCFSSPNNWFLNKDSAAGVRSRNGLMFKQPGEIRYSFINMIQSIIEITEQDSILLSFVFIIILFSQSVSMCEDGLSLKDPLAISRAQSYYTKILWNYMITKWDETKAHKQFIQLFTGIFRVQSGEKDMRQFLNAKFAVATNLDLIAPLMQTVLHIS